MNDTKNFDVTLSSVSEEIAYLSGKDPADIGLKYVLGYLREASKSHPEHMKIGDFDKLKNVCLSQFPASYAREFFEKDIIALSKQACLDKDFLTKVSSLITSQEDFEDKVQELGYTLDRPDHSIARSFILSKLSEKGEILQDTFTSAAPSNWERDREINMFERISDKNLDKYVAEELEAKAVQYEVPEAVDFRFLREDASYEVGTPEYDILNHMDDREFENYLQVMSSHGITVEYDNDSDTFNVSGGMGKEGAKGDYMGADIHNLAQEVLRDLGYTIKETPKSPSERPFLNTYYVVNKEKGIRVPINNASDIPGAAIAALDEIEELDKEFERRVKETQKAKQSSFLKNKEAKWKDRLQKVYDFDFDQFVVYNEAYGIANRLGFDSAEEAWEANPLISGSTDPKDLKVVKADSSRKVKFADLHKFSDEEISTFYQVKPLSKAPSSSDVIKPEVIQRLRGQAKEAMTKIQKTLEPLKELKASQLAAQAKLTEAKNLLAAEEQKMSSELQGYIVMMENACKNLDLALNTAHAVETDAEPILAAIQISVVSVPTGSVIPTDAANILDILTDMGKVNQEMIDEATARIDEMNKGMTYIKQVTKTLSFWPSTEKDRKRIESSKKESLFGEQGFFAWIKGAFVSLKKFFGFMDRKGEELTTLYSDLQQILIKY